MHARTRLVAALLTVVVLTAGCVSAPGGAAPYQPPLDGEAVASGHDAALAAAGTYTVTANTTASLGGERLGASQLIARVDRGSDRAFLATDTVFGQVHTYVANDTIYQRVGDENPQYRVTDRAVDVGVVAAPDLNATVSNYTFVANGTTTLDGRAVWVYEANQTGENASVSRDLGSGLVTVGVNVTLYLRDEGLVVRQVSNATITANDGQLEGSFVRTVEYSDVGSTTVQTPDWLDEARNGTAG